MVILWFYYWTKCNFFIFIIHTIRFLFRFTICRLCGRYIYIGLPKEKYSVEYLISTEHSKEFYELGKSLDDSFDCIDTKKCSFDNCKYYNQRLKVEEEMNERSLESNDNDNLLPIIYFDKNKR